MPFTIIRAIAICGRSFFCIKKGGILAFLSPVSDESDAAHILSHGKRFGDSEP